MKGKNILVTVALVLSFGGIIATNRIADNDAKKLKDEISNLRSDMEAADASNKAQIKAEYTALINQTRDNLKAAYEAADDALLEGLQQLKAELKTAIEDIAKLSDEADITLANQLAAKIANLISQLEELSDSVLDFGDEYNEDLSTLVDILVDVYDEIAALDGRVEEIEDAFGPIGATLDAFATTLSGLQSTVVALGNSLDALEATLDSNYYTITQVNGLLGSVNAAIETLAGLFKVNGTIVSMADLMNTLDQKFADFNTTIGTLETKADAEAAFGLLQDALDSINDRLEEFYGEAAKEAKGQLVNKLTSFYLGFKGDVIDAKKEQIKSNNSGVLPAEYVDLFNNIDSLYSFNLRAVLDEGISRIILAANVTEAAEMEAEFELRMESVMFKVMFLAEQQIAVQTVNHLVTSDCPVNFTQTIADAYNSEINAISFDDDQLLNMSAAEALAYYEELIQDINDIVMVATGYNTLVNDLKAANVALDALSVTLTADQINTFKAYNNSVAAFVNYDNAVSFSSTQSDVDNAIAAIEEKFDIVAYGAQTFADAEFAVAAAKATISGLTNLLPAHVTVYNNYCDATLPFDDYNTEFGNILANYTDVDDAKADIDEILDVNNNDLDVITYAAQQYNVLLGEAAIKNAAIDNCANLSAEQAADFKGDLQDTVDFLVFESSLLTTLDSYTDIDNAKQLLDADIDAAKDDISVIGYAAETFNDIATSCNDVAANIDALSNLSASEKDALKDLATNSASYAPFATGYSTILASYTDEAEAEAAIDALAESIELKLDLVDYGSDEYNDFDGETNTSNSAIDALTNLSSAEKDAFKAYNTAAGDFTAFLTVFNNILSTANDLDSGKAAIDDAIEGNAARVNSAVYAATNYDDLKADAAANNTAVDGYSSLSEDDKETLKGLTDSIITFADYNAFVGNLLGAGFVDTDAANAAIDSEIASSKAALEHTKDLGASYNSVVEYRNNAKLDVSKAVDHPYLVMAGYDVSFNNYLDNMFNLAQVVVATSNFSTTAEFDVYVAALEESMDNVVAAADIEEEMMTSAQDTYTSIISTYSSDYHPDYFVQVASSAFFNYSAIGQSGTLKGGLVLENDNTIAILEEYADRLASDLEDVENGIASFKSRIDTGLLTKAQMDGYIGTYETIYLAHCYNDNNDHVTVWNNYVDEFANIEAQYAYLYGAGLNAVPTIAAGESYQTTKLNFNLYIAGLESDAEISARYVAYTTAINALLPQMRSEFHELDLQYAAVVAKAAIGDNLDGASGTLKATFDSYIAAAGTDVDKVALLNTSYAIYIMEIADAVNSSSADVKSVVNAAITYWATL